MIPFSSDAAGVYARIRADLEIQGKPIGPNNLLIAATVMATGGTTDYQKCPGIQSCYQSQCHELVAAVFKLKGLPHPGFDVGARLREHRSGFRAVIGDDQVVFDADSTEIEVTSQAFHIQKPGLFRIFEGGLQQCRYEINTGFNW